MALTAYNGNDPYIFISYAHKDSGTVLPIIESLTASGFHVWYDAGIEAGTEWPEYIATKLTGSSCVVAFISNAALDSQNCRREINYAISQNKEMLSIYLENVQLSPGMAMQLGTVQGMYYNRSPFAVFMENLKSAPILAACRGEGNVFVSRTSTPESPASVGLEFELNAKGNGYKVSGIGSCTDTQVVIPRSHNGKPVTEIGKQAFFYCDEITSVIIPDGVTSIGDSAFSSCEALTSITIPSSVTGIDEFAFSSCQSLPSITVPNGVTKIEQGVFSSCKALKSIVLPNSVTEIKNSGFYHCESLASFTIPEHVTRIGELSFGGCYSLRSIIIPRSVTSISDYAFHYCDSDNLTIYCEAESKPYGWNDNWNSYDCPVVWGYKRE